MPSVIRESYLHPHNASIPSPSKAKVWVGGRNHELYGPASDRCPDVNNSSVCSRVLPVCQHRPVRYPLDIPTSPINQTMPVAAVKVSYVLRIPPKNMNHNAEFSLEQQTTYYSYRFPIPNNISLCCVNISNCVVYYHFLWLGRESSWLTCLPQYPTLPHTHMSLLIDTSPSLHCLGSTVRILGRLRHPMIQHH